MATFIKNNCECCQTAVCESCDLCADIITTTKQFLAPGSAPQEGVILLPNTITVQLANIQIRPCGCTIFDPSPQQVPCTSGLCPDGYCEFCAEQVAIDLPTLYNPKVLEYAFSPTLGVNGYFSGGCVYAAEPNTIFVLGDFNYPFPIPNAGGVYIGNAPFGVCDGYGQYFFSCGLIEETENSLTYAGGIGYPYSNSYGLQGWGGTATITW